MQEKFIAELDNRGKENIKGKRKKENMKQKNIFCKTFCRVQERKEE